MHRTHSPDKDTDWVVQDKHREVESSLFVNFTHALRPCDGLCMSPKANSMKDRDRNPALSLSYPLAGKHEFCVSRVLVGCALTTIESFDNLRTAKRYMRRISVRVPGSYVVF